MEEKKSSKKSEVILINKMCTGEYNTNNIGHEIINYFKPDKKQTNSRLDTDCTYIYINPYGGMSTIYNKRIDTIILTSEVLNKRVEILAILKVDENDQIHMSGAKGIKEINKKKKKAEEIYEEEYAELKYGGVPLQQIFRENDKKIESPIYVTFKVKDGNMYKPKEGYRLYVSENEEDEDSDTIIKINTKKLAKSSLKEYFINEDKIINGIKYNDYRKIKEFIEKDMQKEEKNRYLESFKTSTVDRNKEFHVNILEIMNKVNEEQIYTNLLAYWFNVGDMFNKFITYYFKETNDSYLVQKERKINKNRADIIAIGDKNIIVIENKILSGLNSLEMYKRYRKDKMRKAEESTTQLGKMLRYIEEGIRTKKNSKYSNKDDEELYNNKEVYGIIFVPEYNKERIEKELEKYETYKINNKEKYYKIVTYHELLDFFERNSYEEYIKTDVYYEYYDAFKRCLANQDYRTINERNKAQIERKFIYSIQKNLNKLRLSN